MTDRIEITEVRDLRTPFILIVSSFTVALLICVSAYLIGYVHGQALRCRAVIPMSEIARDWFHGTQWEFEL